VALRHSHDEDSLFAPSFSLAAVSTSTAVARSTSGSLALRWQALLGGVCPIVVPVGALATLRPCAVLEVGALRGDGVGLVRARRNEATWLAAGVSLHGEVPLASKLFLELDVGASAPFDHARFVYSSGTVAFATPPLGLRSSLVLAVHL
jgi:hypothetical protein